MTVEKEKNNSRGKRFGSVILLFLLLFNFNGNENLKAETGLYENIKFPQVNKFKLDNGIKVFTIKDELPKTTIFASIGFGKLYESKKNAGISGLIAKTLILSGSKKYPGEKLHEEIESIGGKISINSSWENTVISVKVLTRYKNKAFDIVSDILLNPNFDEKYLIIARSLFIEDIKRKKDRPGNVAFEKLREIIFNENGYGATPDENRVASFSGSLLVRTWEKYFNGGNTVVGVSSDLNFSRIKADSVKYFSSIKEGKRIDYELDYNKLKNEISSKSSKIYLIRKNVPQATIVVGTIIPNIGYKGKYALTLSNYILGGGSFNSRLMKEIRVKKGLAYSVQSIMRFRYKTGLFLGFVQTKNESVGKVMSIMLENINKMAKSKVKNSELEWAKKYFYNSYIFKFDTPMNILSNYLHIEYNKLPDDYYLKYLGYINNINSNDILDESKMIIQGGLIKVVVGKPELKKKLQNFGEVVMID